VSPTATTLENLTDGELLALVVEVIVDGLPYDDTQGLELPLESVEFAEVERGQTRCPAKVPSQTAPVLAVE
jgi:hypothetical protein